MPSPLLQRGPLGPGAGLGAGPGECSSSFQLGEDTKAKQIQAQPGGAWGRLGGVLLSLCLVLDGDTALGGAVLVAQAGAAPVQPQLLPRGFPLANRALLIRGGDAQGRPLAPAAQAGLGRHKGEKSYVGCGERGGNIPVLCQQVSLHRARLGTAEPCCPAALLGVDFPGYSW